MCGLRDRTFQAAQSNLCAPWGQENLTSPIMGLGQPNKASLSLLAPLTPSPCTPFREPLAGPLGQDWACSQNTFCLLPIQEKARLPFAGNSFFSFSLSFAFLQPPPRNPESFKVTTRGPKSNPCPQAPAGISPRSPTFLLQLHNPATLLTSTPAIPLCGQLSKCSQTSPFSPQAPKTAAKSQQLCRGSLVESG